MEGSVWTVFVETVDPGNNNNNNNNNTIYLYMII